jgi:hypothetical protein
MNFFNTYVMRRAGKIAVAAVLIAAGLSRAFAQGGPPMITDDPGTPGDGHWEINIAALSDHAGGIDTYQLPLLDINYGIGERIQLKYEMPWLFQRGDGDNRSGVGNALAGVKWRFFDAGEDGWQISTYPQVEFNPPGSSSPRRGLADAGSNWLLPLEFEHKLGDIDIDFEGGRWFRSAALADSWIAGFVVGHEVSKGFEIMTELHDEAAVSHGGEELTLNVGATWDFSERCTLLLSAGRDLHDSLRETDTLLTYVGVQMRL